jgi:hypothetical protein
VELKDRWVYFHVRDLFYPQAATVLTELHGNDLFQGRVVDTTDDGESGQYVVVQVDGVAQPLIVPVRDLLRII